MGADRTTSVRRQGFKRTREKAVGVCASTRPGLVPCVRNSRKTFRANAGAHKPTSDKAGFRARKIPERYAATKGPILQEDARFLRHARTKLQSVETSEARLDKTTGRNRRIHYLDGGRQHPNTPLAIGPSARQTTGKDTVVLKDSVHQFGQTDIYGSGFQQTWRAV